MNNIATAIYPGIGHNQSPEAVTEAFRVDPHRGSNVGTVSSQWASRPADQRFTSLNELFASVAARRDSAHEEIVEAGKLMVVGKEEDPTGIWAHLPSGRVFTPSHFSFGQLCSLAKAGGTATTLFRSQPGWLAGLNLTWALSANMREQPIKLYGDTVSETLRASTGPNYGRIYDADVVAMVQRFAGNGTGDTRWKVPGVLDWKSLTYNPFVNITKDTTTLFASDRDCFMFLVDDTHPIDIGKLSDGSPDLIFRGFMVQNSEVGTRSMKISKFWLRGVCCNRNLWGVEDMDELTIVHSKLGPARFARNAERVLEAYANSDPTELLAGINASKATVIARDEDDRKKFLTSDKLGFSLLRAQAIIQRGELEGGRPPETAWDFVNAITATARAIQNQDDRIDMERVAAKVMTMAVREQAVA